ncbi:hypothetical protein KR222_008055, partial [Zaprionus bogoriensis]
ALLQGERRSIDKCLRNFGGLNQLNADRLERYTEWSDSTEEIPCFTQCYLREMYDFYDEQAGFNEQRIRQLFGNATYEACRQRLQLSSHQQSSCEHAYAGFHCLVSLEEDPFILIENMPNTAPAAKTAMKDCLQEVQQMEWSQLREYARFPVREPIPCFTRCFIHKLELFDERTRRWRLPAMRQLLGVPQPKARVTACIYKQGNNPCSTTYQQFTCFVLAV